MASWDHKTPVIGVQRALGSLVSHVNGYLQRGYDLELQLREARESSGSEDLKAKLEMAIEELNEARLNHGVLQSRAESFAKERELEAAESQRLRARVDELEGKFDKAEEQRDSAEASMVAKIEEVSSLRSVVEELRAQLLQISLDSDLIVAYKASEEFEKLVTDESIKVLDKAFVCAKNLGLSLI